MSQLIGKRPRPARRPRAAHAAPSAPGWHARSADEVLRLLAADAAHGLTAAEAARRLRANGPNAIEDAERRSRAAILLAQLRDWSILVLAAAAALSLVLGERTDALVIVAILVLDALLGFIQDDRAERAIAALKKLATPVARARRDGEWREVPAATLVTGDVVAVAEGDVVPADLRLLEAARLLVDESLLTGESQPAEKSADAVPPADASLGDRNDMCYSGSAVDAGRGVGVVVATGAATELGQIAAMVSGGPDHRTPLQRRLDAFARQVAGAVVALSAVLVVAGVASGRPPMLMVMTALSLAVAAIPEALPAVVTIALAVGARRMVRRHALVRHLPSVETLGSVTVICADKTGTLTEGRMRVERVLAGPRLHQVHPTDAAGEAIHRAMALVNDATVTADGVVHGDATERALLEAALVAHAVPSPAALPRIAELPFSSERGRMTTVHREGEGIVAYTKGAPERVIAECVEASPAQRNAMLRRAGELAALGLRVLAFSERRTELLPDDLERLEEGQVLLGLVGIADPPRAAAPSAIAECKAAGIRVLMITGDHPETARAIARRVGLSLARGGVAVGREVHELPDAALDRRVASADVYARVDPRDKLRIVQALQRAGAVVAMTGDGANDAPALRQADIGVAMGRHGTDVAREASDMVLLDDDFGTIVSAVREGRRVHDNIRRFLRYTLATNLGELLTIVVAPLLGLPLTLLPVQILWMNLMTDGLPGVALAAEPEEDDVMRRPPVPAGEGILAGGLWQHVAWVGPLMAALSLGVQGWTTARGYPHWQSMTFTVLTFAQLAHALAIRSERASLFSRGLFSNRPLVAALAITVALHLGLLYLPAANGLFGTAPLTLAELAACVAVAAVVFVAVEGDKWRRRAAAARRRTPDRPGATAAA